jgi:hypothetical protein
MIQQRRYLINIFYAGIAIVISRGERKTARAALRRRRLLTHQRSGESYPSVTSEVGNTQPLACKVFGDGLEFKHLEASGCNEMSVLHIA